MVRTTVTPNNTELHLSIPIDYVGKQVEVLLYTSDEVTEGKPYGGSSSRLRGQLKLTDEQHRDFHQYLNDIRDGWSRDI